MFRSLSVIALAAVLLAPMAASAAATFSFTGACTDCALLLPTRPFDPGTPLKVELVIAAAAVTPGNALTIADLNSFLVNIPLVDGSLNIFGIQNFTPADLDPGASFAAVLTGNAKSFVDNAAAADLAMTVASETEFFRLLTDAAGNWSVATRVFEGRGTDGFWVREVPEPASAAVLAFGLLALLLRRGSPSGR